MNKKEIEWLKKHKKNTVILVYNKEGKFEGLLENSMGKPWITTLEKATAYISTIDENYRNRYITKAI